jgi:hypothetical protein
LEKSTSGDLCHIDVVDSFVDKVGEHSVDLVTGDGGFDFSGNFNDQEEMSLKLITSEVYTALRLNKDGGSFILKVYDIQSTKTIELLYILSQFYEDVLMYKPLTSRPANSEKYVVCINHSTEASCKVSCLDVLRKNIVSTRTRDKLGIHVPTWFMQNIHNYNTRFVNEQIFHIRKTIDYIVKDLNPGQVRKNQLDCAVRWCHLYNIRINVKSVHYWCTKS